MWFFTSAVGIAAGLLNLLFLYGADWVKYIEPFLHAQTEINLITV